MAIVGKKLLAQGRGYVDPFRVLREYHFQKISTKAQKGNFGREELSEIQRKIALDWKVTDYNYCAVFDKAFELDMDIPHIWGWIDTRKKRVAVLYVVLWDWEFIDWVKFAYEKGSYHIREHPYRKEPEPYEYPKVENFKSEAKTLFDSSGEEFVIKYKYFEDDSIFDES